MSPIRMLSLATALLVTLFATRSEAAGEVRVLRAQASLILGRTPIEGLSIDVLVKNLAYDKRVTVHIDDGTGTFADVAGSYVRAVDDQTELWQVRLYYYDPSSATATYSYSIKYEVAGMTFVDDNGGKNYALHVVSDGLWLQTPVLLNQTSGDGASGDYFGTVDVQNLAYAKKVNIVYTTDNWATTQTTAASYLSSYHDNAERWSFRLPGITHFPLQLAISYEVGGVTYWDNNFGKNYTMSGP